MINLAIVLSLHLWTAAACIRVDSDRILTRDLAAQIPSFNSIPGDTVVGFTPLPGSSRVLPVRKLSSLASRHGLLLPATAQDLCVERAGAPLSRSALLAAMKKALGIEAAQIDLVDYSKSIFPSGNLEFSLATLSPPPANSPSQAVIWRGRLEYGDRHTIPVWAQVRISVSTVEYVAARDLIPGGAIAREDIREIRAPQFPNHLAMIQSPAEVVGRSVRRALKAGEMLRSSMLVSMPEVARGDAVTVTIQSGAARLKLAALAESSGRTGDVICLQNPENHRLFRGKVTGKDEISVSQREEIKHVANHL